MENPDISSYDEYQDQLNYPNVDEYLGAEFFSSILWDIRSKIGASVTDVLVYDALYNVTGSPDFLEFRDAMLSADANAYNGVNYHTIRHTFADAGVGEYLPPSIDIRGESAMFQGTTQTFTAAISNGHHPPFSYAWYFKDDQSDSWTFVSSTSSYDHTAQNPSEDYIKLVVTDAKDASSIRVRRISVAGMCCN